MTQELLKRVREAEDAADLDYLRNRVPGAFDRAEEGITRVGAIVSAMRDFGHPPTADRAPVQLNDALRNTLVVAMNEYKYVSDVETDLGDLPGGRLQRRRDQPGLPEPDRQRRPRDRRARARARRDRRSARRSRATTSWSASPTPAAASPTDVAARIFDPFFTTKEVGRGTGQGLSITRSLVVDRHGGTITFDTKLGEGTTFHVRLPIDRDAALGAGGGMIRVLFVDDETHVLESLRDALRPWRRELTMAFAADGPTALEEVAREPYDAVVSDMRMPGMDGAELLREVQRVQPATVRIVLSGYAEIESVARAATVAHRFLSKPCDVDELVSVIGRSCAHQRARRAGRAARRRQRHRPPAERAAAVLGADDADARPGRQHRGRRPASSSRTRR